jgi:hypothetical protein
MKLAVFRTDFRKVLKYQIFLKSALLEPSCFMRTDGETDMTKLAVAFCNFANAPRNNLFRHLSHANGEDGARMGGPMADSVHRQCEARSCVDLGF